ncbi:hypothetical protein Tco_0696407, partial [Tanacetum coccineum]
MKDNQKPDQPDTRKDSQ